MYLHAKTRKALAKQKTDLEKLHDDELNHFFVEAQALNVVINCLIKWGLIEICCDQGFTE